jgi:uncharacterized membrane protein
VSLVAHRQPAQAIGLAAVSIIALVALLAFVVDAASFFIIRSELQNAADAAALAGVALCPCPPNDAGARAIAEQYVRLNAPNAEKLCRHTVAFNPVTDVDFPSASLNGGSSPAMRVTVRCQADYTFGRIINLVSRTISANATAVLGRWDTSVTPHQIVDYLTGTLYPAVRLVAEPTT